MCNKENFSFNQMVSNSKTNKTSASGVVGVLFCLVGLLLFFITTIGYFFNVGDSSMLMTLLDKILILIACGACLLGVRKFGGIKSTLPSTIMDNEDECNKRYEAEKLQKLNS